MNIDFLKDNNRFNARVSAIIYNSEKNKVLLFKVDDGRNFYLLPGGRIEYYEDSNWKEEIENMLIKFKKELEKYFEQLKEKK